MGEEAILDDWRDERGLKPLVQVVPRQSCSFIRVRNNEFEENHGKTISPTATMEKTSSIQSLKGLGRHRNEFYLLFIMGCPVV